MDLKEILKLMPKNNWLPTVASLVADNGALKVSEDEFKELINNILDSVNNNRIGKCLDWISLAMLIDKDKAVIELKKKWRSKSVFIH